MSAKKITYSGCGYFFCIVISINDDIGSEFGYESDIRLELPITRKKTSAEGKGKNKDVWWSLKIVA